MVSKRKKTAKKVQEPTEKVEAPLKVDEEPVVAFVNEESTLETVDEIVDEEKAEPEPKVKFIDETPKLIALLADAPPVPLLTNMHQTIAFVDDYRRWKLRVKAETG